MVKPRIWLIVLIILMLGSSATETSLQDKRRPQSETLIIDLSKRLPENPYQQEYERMLYSTVRIKTLFSTGSGVVIGDYIITAAHVVDDATDVRCERWDLSNEITATVLITDTIKDLALLKPSRPLSYTATLAPGSYIPYIFRPVYTVGCSLGLTPRPSSGIITYIGDNLLPSASYWEVSSPILPGNSGGPVFDANTYEVIGIAVWIHTYKNQLITTMAGVVPINQIYKFLKQYTDSSDKSAQSAY